MEKKNKPHNTALIAVIVSGAAIALICLLIYNYNTAGKGYSVNSYSRTAEALGTIITITLYDTEDNPMTDDELKDIADRLFDEADRLENIFSAKDSDSELSHLNNSAAKEPTAVSDELYSLIELSLEYCQLSDGALDISLGRLSGLWNIGGESPYLPQRDEVLQYIAKNNWKNIIPDENHHTISYADKGIAIDLGATAKGYAGDILKTLAESLGISHAVFNMGGNIVTIGGRFSGGGWHIAVTDPLSPDTSFAAMDITDMSVVTSGNYERYFEQDGVRYHHILDPATGFPADSGVISVTVIGPSSARCDALSTACYVLGAEKGLALINSLEGYEAIFIDNDGNASFSSGIEKYNYKELSH